MTGVLHVELIDAEGGIEAVHRVEVVAEVQATHHKRYLCVALLIILGGHGAHVAVLLARHLHLGAFVVHVVVESVHTDGEFPLLGVGEQAGAHAASADAQLSCGGVAVERLLCHGVLFVHDDVEHAACTLGIIFGTGVGHHLDTFHHGRGHRLEHL